MAMTDMQTVVPYVDATPLLDDPAALRAHAADQGFLYFRAIIPAADLQALRQTILQIADRHGFIRPGTPLDHAVANDQLRITENMKPYRPFYEDVLRCRDFHAMSQHPALIAMYDALFGEPTCTHSRNIARVIFPQMAQYTTPAHQDHVHIHGTENTWTAWIPLGDMPDELGGLAIAGGTHRLGLLPTHAAYGAGGSGCDLPPDTVWSWSPMTCGDILTFHSLTVHQGRDNRTPDTLRLSLDYRYQPRSQPIAPSSMKPHMGYMDWDAIYDHWPLDAAADPLQYYWQDWDLDYQEPAAH